MPWRIEEMKEREYLRQVNNFLTDKYAFQSFKRSPLFARLNGTPRIEQAYGFFKLIMEDDPELFSKLPEFSKMDDVGGVWKFPVVGGKTYSLNLIRYADTLRVMRKHDITLDGMRVFEFGPSYGGLAYCAHCLWKPAAWNIHDLEPVEVLAAKHSEELGIELIVGKPESYDVAIAEYSLTEYTLPELLDHTEKYLFPANQIWVRSNIVEEHLMQKWTTKLREQFDLTIFNEDPVGVKFNKIVIGKK